MNGKATTFAVYVISIAHAACAFAPLAALGQTTTPRFKLSRSEYRVTGTYGETRATVESLAGKNTHDATADASLSIADPSIASVDDFGFIRAKKNGRTTLRASISGVSLSAPVTILGVSSAPPSFVMDVVPALTRAGCDMGSCHGAAQGKGGFRLALQGYDPEYDYTNITRAGNGRRVNVLSPENSLLLQKPLLTVPHKGGLRLRKGSAEYRILRDWIAAGMPDSNGHEPKAVALDVRPSLKSLPKGQAQKYTVFAKFSDGSSKEVTSRALFSASNEQVARVTPDGTAKSMGPGEGAVLIRYESIVAAARVVTPFAPPLPVCTKPLVASRIDTIINSKLASLGLPASPRCSDTDFVRRVSLDLIGQLPSADEARSFASDKAVDKQTKLIDNLMARPEFVDFWTMKLGDLMRSNRKQLGFRGMYTLNNWIRESLVENKPWDQMAREVITAKGSTHEVGPANFFRSANTPETLSESAVQTFLGVRIQCARCHNHPYEKWTQNQYWQMASFFARVKSDRPGDVNASSAIRLAKSGEVNHPKTQKSVTPCALDAKPISDQFSGDRREALADWITAPSNPFFARTMANRLWKHFMGKGLVEPVDDMRATNPPSNPALLDHLGVSFVAGGYDLRKLMRSIVTSEAYQRTSEALPGNVADQQFYSRFYFKRLGAEQLMDAISSATGSAERFDGYPVGFRAAQLPDTTPQSYFLELFGRPARQITCDCERSDEPNLGQILHLMNNSKLSGKISDGSGRVADLAKSLPSASFLGIRLPKSASVEPQKAVAAYKQVTSTLFQSVFSREPNNQEVSSAVAILKSAKYPRLALEDILWAMLNSKEFLFNH